MVPSDSVEQIPDGDQVSHCYFDDSDELAPETYFAFQYDKVRDERAESVYWRKYAPQIDDVHQRGCKLQQKWFYLLDPEPSPKYVGARTAQVVAIRRIVSGRGHTFRVIHYPQDGDLAHAHISIERVGGNVKKLNKNDRMELTALLVNCFEDFRGHECLDVQMLPRSGPNSGPNEETSGGELG